MTLYRRENNFRATRIGDADALMQELFNAVDALKNLDQNNFKDASITPVRAIPSSEAVDITRSLTVGQKNGALLRQVLTGINTAPVLGNWATSANSLDLEFVGELRLRLYAYGQYFNNAAAFSKLDVQYLIDGSPGARVFTHNMQSAGGISRVGWNLTEEVALGPGRHSVRIRARDRSSAAGELRLNYTGAAQQATVMAIGFRP